MWGRFEITIDNVAGGFYKEICLREYLEKHGKLKKEINILNGTYVVGACTVELTTYRRSAQETPEQATITGKKSAVKALVKDIKENVAGLVISENIEKLLA